MRRGEVERAYLHRLNDREEGEEEGGGGSVLEEVRVEVNLKQGVGWGGGAERKRRGERT